MVKSNLLQAVVTCVIFSPWAGATVQIQSVTPSLVAPQVIGSKINWVVTATDTSAGPLTFQFNVTPPGGTMIMVQDFNVGTYSSGIWTSPAFAWTPTGSEGVYQIEVVARDFGSKTFATRTVSFQVNPLVTGTTGVVVPTANPLVALFSTPPCAIGSKKRVRFTKSGAATGTVTPWVPCTGSTTMTFEIAGMYPSTTYEMFGQTETGSTVVNGPTESFTTGSLPTTSPIPKFTVKVPPGFGADTAQGLILADLTMPGQFTNYPEVATDLSGNIVWYYYSSASVDLVTRPLSNGTGILTIENGSAWNPAGQQWQLLRRVDWAGNITKETNVGAIQQELLALGATDAQPCNNIPKPPPVGAGCLDDFNHDLIRTLPNGYSAVLSHVEKIYPAGTQGDTSGLPVDIIGDMIVVLNSNWQAVWYFDAFEHASGAPQLDINRRAVLDETCAANQLGCPPAFLLGSGVAPLAYDWLHGNSLYYWPAPQDGAGKGDLIWSARHQDWVMRINYKDGAGNGNILWRMGPDGDFSFNNVNNDPWPWFSHQHDVGIERNGDMSVFDNGNTRVAQLGGSCGPHDCNSRGMVLQFSESNKHVTPVLSVDLGVYASAVGSAQLLSNNNYAFLAGSVNGSNGYFIEILPTPGTITGTQVFNIEGTLSYRAWRMTSLYTPPIT